MIFAVVAPYLCARSKFICDDAVEFTRPIPPRSRDLDRYKENQSQINLLLPPIQPANYNLSAFSGVSVTGPSKPEGMTSHPEASNGL
jgi:hypothetical protein